MSDQRKYWALGLLALIFVTRWVLLEDGAPEPNYGAFQGQSGWGGQAVGGAGGGVIFQPGTGGRTGVHVGPGGCVSTAEYSNC